MLSTVWDFITGEFIFNKFKVANSGFIVLVRSLWIVLWSWLASFLIFYFIDTFLSEHVDEIWWSTGEYKTPWKSICIIFSASYINLYTRFSSQWKYLSDLYNDISRTDVQIEVAHQTSDKAYGLVEPNAMINWKASFIVDAYRLHLSRKPIFYSCIKSFLDHPKIERYFRDGNSMLPYSLIVKMKETIKH